MKMKGVVKPSRSGKSIDFYFVHRLQNKRYRLTIDMPPTADNLSECKKIMMSVQAAMAMEKISRKPFDIAEFLPDYAMVANVSGQSVGKAMAEWLKHLNVRHNAITSYNKVIKTLKKDFSELSVLEGDKLIKVDLDKLPVSKMTFDLLQQWISLLQKVKHKKVRTIRNRRIILNGTLDREVALGNIDFNPFHKLGKIKAPEWQMVRDMVDRVPDPFNLDEIYAVKTRGRAPMKYYFQFAVWTGMRIAELFALAWEDIDWVRKTANVHRACTEEHYGLPKTAKSFRTIKLLPEAIEALKAMKPFTFLRAPVECGQFGLKRIIFYDPIMDKPFTDDQDLRRHIWSTLLRDCGVRYRPPKKTRHTFISIMASSGEREDWVRDQVGHVDEKMIRDVYKKYMIDVAVASGHHDGEKAAKLMENYG